MNFFLHHSIWNQALRKIQKFELISWYGNFLERHSFCRVLSDSPKYFRKLRVSKTPSHQNNQVKLRYLIKQCKSWICLPQVSMWWIFNALLFSMTQLPLGCKRIELMCDLSQILNWFRKGNSSPTSSLYHWFCYFKLYLFY